MNKNIELTHVQANRIAKTEAIIRDFKASEGSLLVIYDKLARKHKVSESTIRNILRGAGLIGNNKNA